MIGLATLGGLFNAIRGGYLNKWLPGGATTKRILFGVATACWFYFLVSQNWWLIAFVALWTWFSCIFGWGTYMDLGANPEGYKDDPEYPIGWLIGPEKIEWSFRERFTHNFVGLMLRGLIFTLPLFATHIWWLGFAGMAMAPIYWSAQRIEKFLPRSDFIPLPQEFLFGSYLWLIIAALAI